MLDLCSDRALERALLALVFADNTNLNKLEGLTPDDLADDVLAPILAAALDVHAEGRPVNMVTLKTRLEGMRLDEERTGVDVVRALSVGDVAPKIEDIAIRLRSLALRRRLADYLRGIAQAIAEGDQSTKALVADALGQLNDYLADLFAINRRDPHIYAKSSSFIAQLESGKEPIEIPTGLVDLDNATGGWHRGQFAILAGRPSMGKSALALSSMLRTAERGYGVLFFSLEMTYDQLVARALTDYAYELPDTAIAYSDLKPSRVPQAHIKRLRDAAESFHGMPIIIDTQTGLTVGDLMTRARKAAEEFAGQGKELALVVIDHLLKVKPSSRYQGQPVKELDEISEGMCGMAKALNVAALGLHQLNRQTEQRDNQRPVLSDLRGSGSLEQDADLVLFAYRPAYAFERLLAEPEKRKAAEEAVKGLKHDLEIQIAKQRNGPTTALQFWVDMKANVVRNASPEKQTEGEHVSRYR